MSKLVQFLMAAGVIVFTVSCTRADTVPPQNPIFECDVQEGRCVAIWRENHCKAMPEQMHASCYRGVENRKREQMASQPAPAQQTAYAEQQGIAPIVPPFKSSLIPKSVQNIRDKTRRSILVEEFNGEIMKRDMARKAGDSMGYHAAHRNVIALTREMGIR